MSLLNPFTSLLRFFLLLFRSIIPSAEGPILHVRVGEDSADNELKPAAPPVHPLKALNIDIKSIEAKYEREREKRLRKDGVAQFQPAKGSLSRFKDDVGATPLSREPLIRETKTLIIGAGFGGVVTAVRLKQRGIEDFVILDKASGFGGTWYWNQYPGVFCDVESYVYLPFLEETGYIPTTRFASGPEILEHIGRVVDKWNLKDNSYLQTKITSVDWDESIRRWHVHTNRDDHFIAQFVVMATGTLHEPQLPGIPGINQFERDHFHTGRWNYTITGGNGKGNMTKLADKTVGIIGTGASGASVIPLLAESAMKLLVFQRTPSTISFRENWDTAPDFGNGLVDGWQQGRMELLASVLQGEKDDECSAIEGLDALTPTSVFREAKEAGVEVKPEDIPELMNLANFRWMEKVRQFIDNEVKDKETADKLKPWYSFMCKRPVFHNDYLATFNRPNVQLVDTDVVANGQEYEVDLLIFATGFEFFLAADLEHRTGIKITGTKGQTIDEAWKEQGPKTMFGVHCRDFPNFLHLGAVQSGVGVTWTHTTYAAGEHIADVIADVTRDGTYDVIEPSEEAVDDWVKEMDAAGDMRVQFHKSCTPSYYNAEGKPELYGARWQTYPKGVLEWSRVMRKWREEGGMKGMERR
ncbi:Ketocytochalasin monooxygenase [Cladobotryum mycophilum]|uniref:Ketocytochalasin monooxygenase n=1 Tax=Cladobotryum mycophilum TaxID=491253 RepID=A0ABR0SVX6_9HYPO